MTRLATISVKIQIFQTLSYKGQILTKSLARRIMNNYIVRSYRDVIIITKFAITTFAIRRRASKAQSIVMY